MAGYAEWLAEDQSEVAALVERMAPAEVEALGEAILAARRVFVAGQGRSGLVLRMFGMRLMQCGLTCHVVGDATTPAIGDGDLLVLASGGGETPSLIGQVRHAGEAGARTALATARVESTLGRMVDLVVVIPGNTTTVSLDGGSRMPLATVVEQTMLIVLDALAAWLAERRGETQVSMMARHANLE